MLDEPEDFEDDELEEIEEFEEPEDLPPEEIEELEEFEETPARKPSRSQARIEALDREAKEARQRAEAAERRLLEIEQGTSRSEAERRAAERQRQLAEMDPWDRAQAEARDIESRTNARLNAVQQQLADSTDRAEFAQACVTNPAFAKVREEVEERLAEARSRGVDVPRETLAFFIIGEKAAKKAPKAKSKAEKSGAANISRERSRPASGSSDSPRGEGKDAESARIKRTLEYKF